MAARDGRVAVVRGDDLALLGQLEPAVDRARGAAEDRPVRRPAPAADRAAAPVEERQLDLPGPGHRDQAGWRLVEHPGRRQEAGLLVRVRVAEHHLLAVTAGSQVGPIARVASRTASSNGPAAGQRVRRLEQRHDVDRRATRRPASARDSTSRTSRGAAVNETTTRWLASAPNRAWAAPIERNVARTSSAVTPGRDLGRGRRPRPRARHGGPRCAGGPRATPDGTRTSRPASAARPPRPRRPVPGRRRRARPGSRAARASSVVGVRVVARPRRRPRRSGPPASDAVARR